MRSDFPFFLSLSSVVLSCLPVKNFADFFFLLFFGLLPSLNINFEWCFVSSKISVWFSEFRSVRNERTKKKNNFEANDRNETRTKNEENKSENMCAIVTATASRKQMKIKNRHQSKRIWSSFISFSFVANFVFECFSLISFEIQTNWLIVPFLFDWWAWSLDFRPKLDLMAGKLSRYPFRPTFFFSCSFYHLFYSFTI